MRKKIFHSFLTLTCLVLAIFTAVLVLGVYQLEQRQLESSLQSETEMLASVVAGSDDGAAQLERLALDRRVTLVNADGSVAFDNYASAATLENHGGREEIVQAHTSGEATVRRNSGTLAEEMVYHTKLLKNGQVLRVAAPQRTVWGLLSSFLPWVIVMLILAVLLAALFLLPLLGSLSDKVDTRIGKRMPFILGGTAVAVIAMLFLPLIDNAYAAAADTGLKVIFIVVLLIVLLAMASYRSPAVALMPDLTVKPLRSKANAIINLMGAVGGILYLILASVMYSKKATAGLAHINYFPIFAVIALVMAISVVILFFTVKEKEAIKEVEQYDAAHPEDDLSVTDESAHSVLPKDVKRSLGFILISIGLWFMGYNAVTTAFTKYATSQWGMATGGATMCLTVATAGAIVSYIPIGALASKIGRKRSILAGVLLLAACFAVAAGYTLFFDAFHPALYILFVLIGFAWAAINVNSLPMVVEMCRGGDVGKYTGFYYTASMAAQVITPMFSGFLMDKVGMTVLFPYAALFVAGAFVTMLFVRHGDSRPIAAKGLEALDVDD